MGELGEVSVGGPVAPVLATPRGEWALSGW